MRRREVMSISLPPEMMREVERAMKSENRTRSELIREALRVYFHSPTRYYTPTLAERRAIERGRAAIRRGDFYTLDELSAHLAGPRKQAGGQKRRTSAARRTRTTARRARRNGH
ncbi:MAG: ribbon-helix-helix protein, CopG family [Planctomycetes bacterium]|nr:ribbon-helix-helix protein, CopG family [Planctomycetota bacterium]MBI3843156.1 ribbon-helix-helix protein, CopG family [Planctomycetota bacterium]